MDCEGQCNKSNMKVINHCEYLLISLIDARAGLSRRIFANFLPGLLKDLWMCLRMRLFSNYQVIWLIIKVVSKKTDKMVKLKFSHSNCNFEN